MPRLLLFTAALAAVPHCCCHGAVKQAWAQPAVALTGRLLLSFPPFLLLCPPLLCCRLAGRWWLAGAVAPLFLAVGRLVLRVEAGGATRQRG